MQYIKNIKALAKQKKISLKKIANEIGMSETGFHSALKNNTLTINNLIKISAVLNVKPEILLTDDYFEFKEKNPFYGLSELSEKDLLLEVLKQLNEIKTTLKEVKQ